LNGVRPRVFAIASAPSDISTATIYHDEFGSLSSNSEWCRAKCSSGRCMTCTQCAQSGFALRLATGPVLPAGQRYDVIIDLHRLRRFSSTTEPRRPRPLHNFRSRASLDR